MAKKQKKTKTKTGAAAGTKDQAQAKAPAKMKAPAGMAARAKANAAIRAKANAPAKAPVAAPVKEKTTVTAHEKAQERKAARARRGAASGPIFAWYAHWSEVVATVLAVLWCLVPVGMSIWCFYASAHGMFPTDEQFAELGLERGGATYIATLNTYRLVFRCVGGACLAFGLFGIIICRKRVFNMRALKARPYFPLLVGLLLWACLCTALADYPQRAFLGEYYLNDGLSSYFLYAGFFLCASMIRQERHRRIVLRVFVVVVCYLAVLMCIQEKVYPDLSFVFPGDRAVVFNQYNHFGYILCMGTLTASGLCLFDRSAGMVLHVIDALCAVFLIYALVLNDTFGAFLGAAFALVLLVVLFYLREKDGIVATLVHRRSFVVAAVLAVVAIIGAAVATGAAQSIGRNLASFVSDIGKALTGAEDMRSAGTGRMALWLDTLQRIGERPIFGFGPMGFVGDHVLTNGDVPHNEYLQIAGYLGLPGLALYLCALGSLIKSRLQRLRTLDSLVVAAFVVWVAYLASATFGNPVFNTAPFMWLMFGLATATTEEEPPLLSLDTQATH